MDLYNEVAADMFGLASTSMVTREQRAMAKHRLLLAGFSGMEIMTGSKLLVPAEMTRAQYIRHMLGTERTIGALQRRRKGHTPAQADALLDALVAWDSERCAAGTEPDTYEISLKYNELLEKSDGR